MKEKKATLFEFTSYKFEPKKKRAVFHYTTVFDNGQKLIFNETITLSRIPNLRNIPKELPATLLKSLHIMLGISYYKFYCATKFSLPYNLTTKEADFWNTVYKHGLGEFLYQNKLNPDMLAKFSGSKNTKSTSYILPKNEKCLVGIGGGKDSVVAAELLKTGGFDIEAFLVQTGKESELVDRVIEVMRVKSLKIRRQLDEKVNQAHRYNGHIPISAIYAFLGIFSAVLYGYSYVVVGNEHSSNFGNITYKGIKVNHQWSKSYEFEKLFGNYVSECISPDVRYFSLLRPFFELRIVKMFASHRKYFPYFSSCNKNFTMAGAGHQGLWCGKCAKCVFVFTLLSAFLSKKELLRIFKKNLYQNPSLLPLFKDILGLGTVKPFDCVGTFEEAKTAMYLARKKFAGDFIVRQLGNKVKYHQEVFRTNKENAVPDQFKFSGMESVLIAGFGKEGKVTKRYLKKYYPTFRVGVADGKQGSDYLKHQEDFDIAIKTPGIKKELIRIPYTTATNIFLAKVKGKYLTIGITGSKGKSTTASLIYHILKTANKNVALLGNIGTPMLGALLKPIKKDAIFVLELSSYQLDDVRYSPDIAVVTNLFEEHLDYHGGKKNYFEAKKNIINYQNKNQHFVRHEKTKPWLKGYQGKAVPFSKEFFESNLLGRHNQSNIGAAAAAAEILKIPKTAVKKAVKSFKGLPHRLENVGTFKGITFYDDAISTTPESTIMAIKALKNIDTIFLGGQDRGYHFRQLEKTLKQYTIRNVVLFPDSGPRMIRRKKDFNIYQTKSMKEAVAFAYANTKKGSVCLLSCASPSYSLWKNFEQKGDEFKTMVKTG